ncbi:MAG: bifunctional phosphopantothenoylcysteine decarboxylase/phosphopantothenate--cysteine ligase CoaBC, partial [Pseudonocardiaceae bacterium]
MSALSGRRIVLGVCGSVAAFKSVEICLLLVSAGAHVVPVMTADSERFLGSATLSALASERVHKSLWLDPEVVPHTSLGRSADVIVVAPATARLIGTYAAGISDSLLTATLLATAAPVVLAPAMHTEMWEHPATQANVATLRQRGVVVVEPTSGPLAGGDHGLGRLADPHSIVESIEGVLAAQDLDGIRVLVTSGGTREPIDPIRYLGNRSSGLQGVALAAEARSRGASVTLVTTLDQVNGPNIEIVRVDTAAEMEEAVLSRSGDYDVVVMAAAVADFRPKVASAVKLHKPFEGEITQGLG